jgi:hypothetical protein
MLYDEEMMLEDLVTTLKENLAAEITAINAEKGATAGQALFLENIPDEKFIFETLSDSMLNWKGFFLMYGLVDTGSVQEAGTGNVIENTSFTVQIATFDKGDKERTNLLKKLLRYRRCIRSLILKNPDMFRGYAKASLASLKPSAFAFNNVMVLTCGADLKASLTAI